MILRRDVERIIFVIGFLLLLGCGVKERPATGKDQHLLPLTTGDLPAGLSITKEKRFLVRQSSSSFTVGRVEILYRIATSGLDPISEPDYTLSSKYYMPDMPGMPVSPAEIKYVAPGRVQVAYDISMGGTWRFDLGIVKNGSVVDSVSYTTRVSD